ncbi:DNA ligase, partial [Acinetobacter baumannii]|nr:DNA ligase [Acinetobacter baumannii]
FPMDEFKDIVEEAELLLQPNFQYHGELLVERDGVELPREIGNGILNSVLKGGKFAENERPIYKVWDFIPFEAVVPKGVFKAPYANRFRALFNMVKGGKYIRIIETRIVNSLSEAYKHCEEKLLLGKEGTVIKNSTAIWKDGTSKEQIKLKLEADCELEVVGINEGKAGSKNEGRAGALSCKSACGQLIVDVAVKNEKLRDELDANPEDWIGRIITVRSNTILKPSASSPNYSLFLPRMVEDCYRLDKTVADDLARIYEQFDNAIKNVQVG